MSRSPVHLAAAAVALRAVATAVTADFEGLAAHAGPVTWEGPAATAHRRRAAAATADARTVAAELVVLADRLDQQGAALAAAEAATARRLRERPLGAAGAAPEARSDG